MIVGLGDRFQIWSKEAWAARRAEQRKVAREGLAELGALRLAAQLKTQGGQ
jgi:MraZ protein